MRGHTMIAGAKYGHLLWAPLLAAALCAPSRAADEWPVRAISVIVPGAAGGTIDLLGRVPSFTYV